MKNTSEKILQAGLILLVLFILTTIFISYKQSQRVHDTDALIAHTTDVLYHTERVMSDALDNETGARGFALTGLQKYLEPLERSETTIFSELAALKKLTAANTEQQVKIDSLAVYVKKRLAYSRRHIKLRKESGLAAAMKLTESGEGKIYTDHIRSYTAAIQEEENRLLEIRRASNRHAIGQFNTILTGLAILIFTLLIIVFIILRKAILLQKKSQAILELTNQALDKDVKQKTDQLTHIFERITDAFAALDTQWRYTYVNKKAGELLNRNPEELIGKNMWDEFPDSRNNPFFDAYHTALEKQQYIYLEEYYPPFDLWLENHIYPSPDGLSIFWADISDKKRIEIKLLKANRLYNFISQVNQMIVHTTDENTLYKNVCNIAITQGEFKMAWIGLVDEKTQNVNPVMFAGDESGYLSTMKKIQVPNVTEGRGPTGTAIREGKHIICHDIANDPRMAPWKDAALARGYNSSIAVPIKKFGKVIGAFTIYASEKHFFDKEEIALVLEATGDISFALEIFEKEAMRKEAEKLLKEERDKFTKIAETSPGLIYSYNRSPLGKATFSFPCASKTIEDMLGFTAAELEVDASKVTNLFHPDDRQSIIDITEASAKNLSPWKCAFRYLHPQKKEIWLEGHTIPRVETNGSITWYGVILDITERMKIEQAIIENEQKYRTFFEGSMDGILLTTPDGRILAANPAATTIFGMSEADIISGGRSKIVDINDNGYKALLEERTKNGKAKGELIMIRKNGEKFNAEISSALFKDANGELKNSMIIRDVTERKKAEQELKDSNSRFEMITRATNDALWEWNFETGDLWGNETHQRLYGLTTADPVPKDAEWIQRIHPEDRHLIVETQSRSLKSDKNIFISEYRFLNADNEYRFIYDRCYILRDKNQKPIRMVGSMMDVTEQKNAELEIIESEKRFRHTLDQMLEGVQIIGHDWRYLYVNDTAAMQGGVDRETLVGYTMMEKYPGIDQTPMFNTLQQCMLERKPQFLINNFVYPNKKSAWFELSIQPVPEGLFILSIDITERKKKEEEIRQSEEKRRLIMTAALDAIICMDINGMITFWNPKAVDIFGWEEEMVLGKSLSEIIIPERYRLMHENGLKNYLKTGKGPALNTLLELRAVNRHKAEFPVELTVLPIKQGDEEFFCAFLRDITQRKEAEEAIKKSEEQYRYLFNYSPMPKWIYDIENFKILEVNEAAIKHYGYSKQEFTSMTVKDIRPIENIDRFIQMVDQKYNSGTFNVGEWHHKKADGSIIIVEISGHPIDYNGRKAMMIIANDITTRKKAEEEIERSEKRFRSTLDKMLEGVQIYDTNWRCLYVNDTVAIQGPYSKKEILGAKLQDNYPGIEHTELFQIFEACKNEQTSRHIEYEFTFPDQSSKWFELSIQPNPEGIFILSVDISERKKAETEIKQVNKELHELSGHLQTIREEERVQIARDIHDELGQQLTGLKLGIEWLNIKIGDHDNQLKEKAKEMISLIKGTIQSVRRISANLRPSMLDDLGLVAALEWQSQEVEKRFGIMVNFISEIPDTELPIELSTALFRIYQETLTNAVRHSGAHEVNSLLKIVDHYIILEVKDNGIGIDEQKRAATKSFGLLGIKERTFALGGTFDLQSEQGKGTFIKIVVPI